MNLFIIYIGGKTETSLIEVHDLRIITAEKIEDTYDEIRKNWFGLKNAIHLDCWGKLLSVENYNIILKDTPSNDSKKIYFVNLGGYNSKEFTELHKNVFIAAENSEEAKMKAKSQIQTWEVPHKDYLYDIDDCINISEITEQKKLYIHLEKTDNPKPFEFICKYTPIGIK